MDNKKFFLSGIENQIYFQYNFLPGIVENSLKKDILLKKINIILLVFISSFISIFSRKTEDLVNVKITYSNSHRRILEKNDFMEICWGRNLLTLETLNSPQNIFNYINKYKLIKDFLKSFFLKNNSNSIFYLEFLIFKGLIENNNIKEIIIAGHQDRIATWLSYLSKEKMIEFSITQHGVLTDITVPNKIFATNIYAYNEFEKKYFENFLVLNSDCTYHIKGLESTVTFYKSEMLGFNIGFFSQQGETENTLKIAKEILKQIKGINLIVYPHPRENKKLYEKSNIEISYRKYENLNAIVTYRSTIIYDYLSNEKFTGEIIYYPLNFKHNLAFSELEGLCKVESLDLLIKKLKEVKKGK